MTKRTEYPFDRLTVAKPEPVIDCDRHGKRWIGVIVLAAGLVIGLCMSPPV